jgi:coenzyme F420-dependent glucose-6-phosphate dehydrogenase
VSNAHLINNFGECLQVDIRSSYHSFLEKYYIHHKIISMIAYHASHEQFAPSELVKLAVMAEQAGFDAIHSSDHFHPWSERQGQSGFSFAWMGAAMQATTIPFGVISAPGQRYHPAIVAQAVATLAEMFPDRLWLELGSGEAINEKITGEEWPAKEIRNERLLECAAVIRKLLRGETVTHRGRINVDSAKLYTLPPHAPMIIGAALSETTAAWMGDWADGLVTVNDSLPKLKSIADSFKQHGGEGKPLYLKVQLSYHQKKNVAWDGAYHQWRTNVIPNEKLDSLRTVSDFDAAAQSVRPEDLIDKVNISERIQDHITWIQSYQELGFDNIILHNVNREQENFIKMFGEYVLPVLSSSVRPLPSCGATQP